MGVDRKKEKLWDDSVLSFKLSIENQQTINEELIQNNIYHHLADICIQKSESIKVLKDNPQSLQLI